MLPRRHIDFPDQFLGDLVGQVDRYGDRVVDPFLDRALHPDLANPVDIVGRRLVIGRQRDELLDLGGGHAFHFVQVVPAGFEPDEELVVEHVVFLPRVAHFVDEGDLHVLVARVDLATTRVDRPEHRFDARSRLRHQARRTRRGDVAAAVSGHLLVESRIGLADAGDHRVVLLAFGIVHRELAAFLGHDDRGPVSFQRERFLYIDGEVDRLLRAVAQTQRGEHVALGRDAQTRTAPLPRHFADLLPKLQLHAAHIQVFGVGGDLPDDLFDLFQFEVDDVVHHVHRLVYVVPELVEIELRIGLERVVHIAQQVHRQQAARIVGAERDLAAGVGRNRHETLVGIAVGNAFADDRIPEQHARFGRLPRVVDDLLPELPGVDVLLVFGVVRLDRELLVVFLPGEGRTHEIVVDLDRDVSARHLARVDLGVDEPLGVGVLDRQRQHQRAAPPVLRHLARRVRVTLHEGHDARRRECRVEHRAARGADVRKVVAHAAAAFHQLDLLLVHAEDAAVGVGGVLMADDEAVRQRRHLEIVADAGHRAALRNDVTEMVEQRENLLLRERVRVFLLDAFDFGSDALVHLARRFLVDVSERVLEGVLADPHRGGEVVPVEILL